MSNWQHHDGRSDTVILLHITRMVITRTTTASRATTASRTTGVSRITTAPMITGLDAYTCDGNPTVDGIAVKQYILVATEIRTTEQLSNKKGLTRWEVIDDHGRKEQRAKQLLGEFEWSQLSISHQARALEMGKTFRYAWEH